jgi:putative acetyltransferase
LRKDVQIRSETPNDYDAVRAVNVLAFETEAEANLVACLRDQATPIISLVADQGGNIVGHIMFSPVALSGCADINMMGLAPMAVVPEQQGKGIGSALVKKGLDHCKQLGVAAVVVLGHPDYYPRFGFSPSSKFGINSEYDVPKEVFMILEIAPNVLKEKGGTVKYHVAFGDV